MAEELVTGSKSKIAILETAAKLFSEYGFAGTTMRDIGDAVGVLPGSLYAHIKNKESLLFEVVQSGIQNFLALEARIGETSGTPEEDLRAAIKFHVAEVAANPQYTQVVFHQWRFLSPPMRKRVIELRRRYADVFRRILERGIADGTFNPDLNASLEILALLGSLNWIPEWYSQKGAYGPEEIGDKLADTMLYGVCVRPPLTKAKKTNGKR
ncbi:MAG: TetR/AcrR family transcriptional regulator [Panacagrimonas sp.]